MLVLAVLATSVAAVTAVLGYIGFRSPVDDAWRLQQARKRHCDTGLKYPEHAPEDQDALRTLVDGYDLDDMFKVSHR